MDVHFTQEPSNPSYFNNGSDANLVWDYTDPHDKIQNIIYSVLVGGTFVKIMVKGSHGVQESPNIPPSYKGRVKIEGRATQWLSRTSTLETILNLTVNSLEALSKQLKVQFSLLWQVSITNINVVVQFYPWFKFYFLLFLGIVMYDNEFERKENKIRTKDKIEPQHKH